MLQISHVRPDGSIRHIATRGVLVKGDWWLKPTTMGTDDQGRLRFTGFLGDYEISSAGKAASSSGESFATALSMSSTVVMDPSMAQLALARQIRRLS